MLISMKIFKISTKSFQSGSAALISFLMFLGISLAILFAFSEPILQSARIASIAYDSKESYYTAESLIEDIIYRLNHNMDVDSGESLNMDEYSAEASITDDIDTKSITITGISGDVERTIEAVLSTDVGVSFNYGVQSGEGGFDMDPNSSVIGNVYSNGNIDGGNVTGTAIAANTAATFADQTNDTPIPPTTDILFRNISSSQDIAQSFQVSTTSYINKIQLYIKRVGNPNNATVRIVTNSGGSPSTTNLLSTSGTLSASLVSTSYGWIDVVLPSNPQLIAGTTYWLVIDNNSQNASNYYVIGGNTSYTSGTAKVGQYAGAWINTSPSGLDIYFNIYMGGLTSSITDIDVGGDAWAHTVDARNVSGSIYCQIGTGCNTTRPDPSPIGFPVSDANILDWKEDAQEGGIISGNYTPTGTSTTLGPKKIAGNFTLPMDHTLILTGKVWVTGNISMVNNNTIRLHSSYSENSGLLLADGRIDIQNNTDFYGSGETGSNIMLLTTSNCPTGAGCNGEYALNVVNNVGENSNDVIFNAQKGTLRFNNNAEAKEATAAMIVMSNNAVITYESGLANANFSGGPGGVWTIDSWQEVE